MLAKTSPNALALCNSPLLLLPLSAGTCPQILEKLAAMRLLSAAAKDGTTASLPPVVLENAMFLVAGRSPAHSQTVHTPCRPPLCPVG